MTEIRSLTSMRFFAAVAIVYSHIYTVAGTPFEWMRHVVLLQGVGFFFVLSGFILSVIYHRANLLSGKWRFYHARFARIYPLYLLALTAGFCLKVFVYGFEVASDNLVLLSTVAEATAIQAWVPNGLLPINGIGWSISAEIFFYAIFPFVKKSRLQFALVCTLGAVTLISVCALGGEFGLKPGVNSDSFFKIIVLNPLIRSMEFLCGVWLGTRFASRPPQEPSSRWQALATWTAAEIVILLVCWGLSAYSFSVWANPATDAVWGGAWKTLLLGSGATPGFVALVWVFAHERGVLSRSLRFPPLVFLGASSYALYLFHELIFELLLHLGGLPAYGTVPAAHRFVISVGLISLMLGVASLGHLLIEQPARVWLRNLGRRQPVAEDQPFGG